MKKTITCIFICLLFSTSIVKAEYLEVTLLGTGTPRPDIDRFGPATVVEVKGRYFVFDAGRGITIRLMQAGIPLSQIEHVFITHLHSDHITGLSDLWLTGWIWQRGWELNLYGPCGLAHYAKNIESAYEADIDYRSKNTQLESNAAKLNVKEISQDGIIYDHEGVKVTAFSVEHGVVDPAYGYRLDANGRSVVISGDTTYSENLIKHSQDVDLLIHEIAAADQSLLKQNDRLKKVMSYHTTPAQSAEIFNQTKPRAAIFTHVLLFGVEEAAVLNEVGELYKGPVYMGEDLLQIGVGDEISIRRFESSNSH
ncbi:MAG: MBL fold metallo-hydrolase [Gammaproteobacteria bacterium]